MTDDRTTTDEESSEGSQSTAEGRLSRRGALAALTGLGALGLGSRSASAGSGDHLGESWSGDPSANHGLRVAAQGSTQFGMRGITEASDGRGILGRATSSTGATRGILGRSDSHGDNAAALLGIATANSGRTYGFQGRSDSYEGRGALGLATASTGNTIGMEGRAASESGTALRGFAYASSGSNYGVKGQTQSPEGTGVLAHAQATSGTTTGVRGRVDSGDDGATAVEGEATDSSGVTYGVKGTTSSSEGYGLYTPDDSKVDGTMATTGTWQVDVDGDGGLKLEAPESFAYNSKDYTGGGNAVGAHLNDVDTGVAGAVIGGGGLYNQTDDVTWGNTVTDNVGTVGGGYANQAGDADSDLMSAFAATVAGGRGNTASDSFATIGGGRDNTASVSDATVAGGHQNTAGDSNTTVAGGYNNEAIGISASVGGGMNNTASDYNATVGGGQFNSATARHATIAGGGSTDNSDSTGNYVYDEHGTVGGGGDNRVGSADGDSTTDTFGTIGGGSGNRAKGQWATIGGGRSNVSYGGSYATIGGGRGNRAGNDSDSVVYNSMTIAGGDSNTADQGYSTVGGGSYNTANGSHATVPGGHHNTASANQAFAAGAYAKAEDEQSFVWNDGSGASDLNGSATDKFSSSTSDGASGVTGAETFHVKAKGGVRMVTSGDNASVTYIPGGSAGWSSTSTRTAKTNVAPVDPESVLAGVESLEVSTWEYRDADGGGRGVTHMGPMAEAFHGAFDLGEGERSINSINADGVAFAAIQGLSAKLDEKDDRIDELEERLAALEEEVDGVGGTDHVSADG